MTHNHSSSSRKQGVRQVFGELNLKKLKVFSVETKGLSDFDLDCPKLKAIRREFGARPNFIFPAEHLDYLYSGMIYSGRPFDDLVKLLQQCPKLSTIGFDSVHFLNLALKGVNCGWLSLPLLRVIRIDYSEFAKKDLHQLLISQLVEYEESIKPEKLQLFVFDQLIDSNRFTEIIGLVTSFDDRELYRIDPPFDLFKEHEILGCLHLSRPCFVINEATQLDEELVVKFKNVKIFGMEPSSPHIGKKLFKRMLNTWTELEHINI